MTVATLRRQSWFEDRNYLLIYWHRFFFVLAESAAMTFRAGFLYTNHVPLPVLLVAP